MEKGARVGGWVFIRESYEIAPYQGTYSYVTPSTTSFSWAAGRSPRSACRLYQSSISLSLFLFRERVAVRENVRQGGFKGEIPQSWLGAQGRDRRERAAAGGQDSGRGPGRVASRVLPCERRAWPTPPAPAAAANGDGRSLKLNWIEKHPGPPDRNFPLGRQPATRIRSLSFLIARAGKSGWKSLSQKETGRFGPARARL